MKYRTGFVTNSSSVSFYVGRKEEKGLTADDVFAMVKECWNDYYDCAERLIRHVLESESEEVKALACVGTQKEIWGEDILKECDDLMGLMDTRTYVYFKHSRYQKEELLGALEKQFGICPDDMEILTRYDVERKQVIRKPWLAAKTYEEARKLGIREDDIKIFVLGDKAYAAGIAAYQKEEALCMCNFESSEAYSEACHEVWGDMPRIDFDLQLGLSNIELVEDEKRKDCEGCQVIVETWDSNIPMGVYNRMKARTLGAVYHGC